MSHWLMMLSCRRLQVNWTETGGGDNNLDSSGAGGGVSHICWSSVVQMLIILLRPRVSGWEGERTTGRQGGKVTHSTSASASNGTGSSRYKNILIRKYRGFTTLLQCCGSRIVRWMSVTEIARQIAYLLLLPVVLLQLYLQTFRILFLRTRISFCNGTMAMEKRDSLFYCSTTGWPL